MPLHPAVQDCRDGLFTLAAWLSAWFDEAHHEEGSGLQDYLLALQK